jgi:hypothetical protein
MLAAGRWICKATLPAAQPRIPEIIRWSDTQTERHRQKELRRDVKRVAGTKEVRSRDALRPLLLLAMVAAGTHTGLKRVATAHQPHAYDARLYVRKSYVSSETLRNAHAAVVKKSLALRNPQRWGEGHACAADGKRLESWRQHLMTAWRSR